VSRGTDPVLPDLGMSGKIGDYRLDGHIGRGGMAVVYLAQDERLDRTVALKIIAPELARDAAFRTRFLHESRAAAAVGHPNIIPVYDAGDAGGVLYVAMRYVQGGDARSLLNRLGPLPFGWAWSITAQVASALDAAHAHGLIHRDVKPANMLLDADSAAGGRAPRRADGSDFDHVYLSDFGISKNSPPGEKTAMGQFAGTLDYVAPEQIEGQAVDGRADLYSLACAGFELLCGTPPFGPDQGLTVMYAQLYAPPPTATARRPDLPAAVDLVLATAMAKNPANRYASCGQFAEELRTALGLVPGESGMPARPRSPRYAGPVAEAWPAAAEQESAAKAAAPTLYGPGWPPSPLEQPPAGPDRLSVDAAGTPDRLNAGAAGTPEWAGAGPAGTPESVGTADRPGRLYPRQPRPHPSRTRLILAVAAAAIVVVAVVVGMSLSKGSAPGASAPRTASSAPASSVAASRQAAAVNHLLGSSAATRNALIGAIRKAHNCAHLPTAVRQIQAVVNRRSAEFNHATAVSTAALSNGATVRSDLLAALRHSLDADRDYLTWAQQRLSSGCTPAARSSAYRAALNADGQADAAKAAFVQVWNPVAARYGLPRKSPGDI